MIHPCPNCGMATPVWPGCPNHSYIVTTDVTSAATGNIVWPLTPSQITFTCDNCSKLRREKATLRAELARLTQDKKVLQALVEDYQKAVDGSGRHYLIAPENVKARFDELTATVARLTGERDAALRKVKAFEVLSGSPKGMLEFCQANGLEHMKPQPTMDTWRKSIVEWANQ